MMHRIPGNSSCMARCSSVARHGRYGTAAQIAGPRSISSTASRATCTIATRRNSLLAPQSPRPIIPYSTAPLLSRSTTLPATPSIRSSCTRHSSSSSTAAASDDDGSYHTPTSATGTLLSELPSISPRSLVRYLDSYVVGQTRAKKVLAVGVWNHYLRVASNQRMRDEAAAALRREQEPSAAAAEEEERGIANSALTQAVKLGELGDGEAGWRMANAKIRAEREAEVHRDAHGEAARALMFGRREREWLLNAGGKEALDEGAAKLGDVGGLVKEAAKFGDVARAKRVMVKTPAEEAGSVLEKKWSTAYSPVEAEARVERGGKRGTEPLYFSSNTVAQEEEKWGSSPSERAAATAAAGLVEERTRRALRDARERLSSNNAGKDEASGAVSAASRGFPSASSGASSTASSASTSSSSTPFLPPTFTPPTLPFFEKSNILLLGPSGSGKTLLLRTLAQALDVPFVHVDATPLTMAGYVGEDVESIIQRLMVEAGWDVGKAQRGIVCIDEVDKLRKAAGGGAGGKDVGGEGVQQALLRMLEGTVVEVANKSGKSGGGKAKEDPAAGGGELGPWYNHRRRAQQAASGGGGGSRFNPSSSYAAGPASFSVDTSSILFVLSGAFVGIDDVIRKRLYPSSSSSASSSSLPSTSTTHQEQQSDGEAMSQAALLSHLTPGDLEQYGLIPEFIGRIPVSVVLNPLSFHDLVRVMTEPRNSLVDQYASLFQLNGIELRITRGAVEEVVQRALCGGGGAAGGGGGARSLRRIMEDVLLDAFYESYGSSSVKYALVDRASVKEGGEVRLFSRGQKWDFEARWSADDEQKEDEGKKGDKGGKALQMDPARTSLARTRARSLIKSRLRRTNRLVDPVIYI